MKSVGYLAVGFCVFAVVVPEFMQGVTQNAANSAVEASSEGANRQVQSPKQSTRVVVKAPPREDAHNPDAPDARPQRRLSGGGRTAVAQRDKQGHFSFESRMNGIRVKVLVDTGASSVAISNSVARRIGIRLKRKDFIHEANTANGKAKYASAMIDEIKIDGIRIRNVRAAVLDDDALSEVLLGMSFLNKLRRFEMRGDQLKLVQ